MPKAITGKNGNNDLNVTDSKIISLSYFNENNTEIKISNKTIDIWIPRNKESKIPLFTFVNSSNLSLSNTNQLALFSLEINKKNVSMYLSFFAENISTSYLFALRYNDFPVINETMQDFDYIDIYCPSGYYFFVHI